ncbi:SubName: Full=Uncharacterized protein {ECO:0000313/EMBL:CCA70928.1} [Serendipita indica DSM 11827]|nr:SubName: Full=Uncharacterized protein {ECO:0000313/EMBL:CCA70928.1} [Serendipita indica DSM 11827]
MKYMDIPQLNQLSRLLSYDSSECNVHTRIEAYSMKPITKDKRMWRNLEREYKEDQIEVTHALFGKENGDRARSQSIDIMAPPQRSSSFTHFGRSPSISNSPIDSALLRRSEMSPGDNGTDNENDENAYKLPGQLDKSERKTLFVLKSTLNAAFPHHDFASLGADQFSREKNGSAVLASLSNTFRSVGVSSPSDIQNGGRPGSAGRGGYMAGISRATTYSAYPGEGRSFSPSSVPTRSEGIDALRAMERRSKGEFESDVVSSTHPVLFGVLDDAIGLRDGQCEVYVWTPPNSETDPHGGGDEDDSEDEWPEGSTDEEDGDESGDEIFMKGSETESEEDSDDRPRPFFYPGGVSIHNRPRSSGLRPTGSLPTTTMATTTSNHVTSNSISLLARSRPRNGHSRSPTRSRNLRLRGSLLWSNHWFFVNRKLKRVLFISIWAKSRGYGFSPANVAKLNTSTSTSAGTGASLKPGSSGGLDLGSERFVGWQGAHGAGARAFAARKTGSSLF